ncbi:unnamed protein product [Owenia fusiformis]|nr:unnamed protein product [Owenia fusiformis]
MDDVKWNDTSHNATVIIQRRDNIAIIISGIILFFIIVFSVIGNVAVIMAIKTNSRLREQISNIFILNLSIVDLCTASLIMMTTFVQLVTDADEMPKIWCLLNCGLNYVFIIASMSTLAFVSIDRYMAIIHPMKYVTMITKQRVVGMVMYGWILGLIFGSVPIIMDWIQYDYWEVICAIDWNYQAAVIYVIAAFIICFLLPGIIMIYCYLKIIKEVKRMDKSMPAAPSIGDITELNGSTQKKTRKEQSKSKHTKKTITSLLIVVAFFFICMTPFCVTKLLKVVLENTNMVPAYANLFASWFQYVASAINPLVYGIFRKDFKRSFRRQCAKISCNTIIFRDSSTSPTNGDTFNSRTRDKLNSLTKLNVKEVSAQNMLTTPVIQAKKNHTNVELLDITSDRKTSASDITVEVKDEKPTKPDVKTIDNAGKCNIKVLQVQLYDTPCGPFTPEVLTKNRSTQSHHYNGVHQKTAFSTNNEKKNSELGLPIAQ